MNGLLGDTGLDITEDGKPGRPLVVLDFEDLHDASRETVSPKQIGSSVPTLPMGGVRC